MFKSTSFDIPTYGPNTPRHGPRGFGLEEPTPRSHSPTSYVFDEKPRLKTSKSTTTLQRVKNAFEDKYGRSPSLPPGSPHMQSYYTPFDLGLRRPLARKFDPQRQLLRLLAKGFSRWIVSVLIITATVTTLWAYSHQSAISSKGKKGFNALTTALLLLMNINIQSAMKQAAIFMRWKIVAGRRQTLRELDLTLGIDSLARVAELTWISRRRPRFLLGCVSWLLLSFSIFGLVATLQLTYAVEDSTGILYSEGEVQIARNDHYMTINNTEETLSLASEQATAHYFGYISSSYATGNASELEAQHSSGRVDPGMFLTFNMADRWLYMFYETNPYSTGTYYTNRTVDFTWHCSGYDVVEGGDGRSNTIVYRDGDRTVPFFVGTTGPRATTFITETAEVCGPRCAQVWVFQAENAEREMITSLYECNITVGTVENQYRPEHSIPDLQARLAAGAIGLEGFDHENTTRQWNRYHPNDWWSSGMRNTPEDVGWFIGQFAAGVIGVSQEMSPFLVVPGLQPYVGSTLIVQWKSFLLILFGLAAVQLLVTVFAAVVGNSVVVKDDSRLAIARLLRPIVERLGSAGCVLDGDDISKTLRSEVVYGVRTTGGWHHLDIGPDIEPVGLFGSFPPGWYDGEVEPEGQDEGSQEQRQQQQQQQHHMSDETSAMVSSPASGSSFSSWAREPEMGPGSRRRRKFKVE